ncbi:hypothetical protein QAD02_001794 [Eretmocerus hayati]|uniref:Uncharacterized protein n=1 Tax=Eretmocerus hayati TaxID=131215 RepID=A0ACC2NHA5_9HYME|nr:hypothetical protein QAD02_001794 [Eretmocerus hayati]
MKKNCQITSTYVIAISSAAAASEQSQNQPYHYRQIVSNADSEPSIGTGGSGGGFIHKPAQVISTQTEHSTLLHGLLDEVAKGADPSNRHGIVNVTKAGHGLIDTTKMDEGSYVTDVILPSLLIALLFLGNAVIVYVIFQYRKRKAPMEMREEVALSALSNGDPQV